MKNMYVLFLLCMSSFAIAQEQSHAYNIKDRLGRTAVHKAVASHDIVSLQLCIDSGANLDEQDYQGRTPLMLAVPAIFNPSEHWYDYYKKTATPIIAMLCAHGADIYVQNNEGKTVITLAQENNFTQAVEIFNADPSHLLQGLSLQDR